MKKRLIIGISVITGVSVAVGVFFMFTKKDESTGKRILNKGYIWSYSISDDGIDFIKNKEGFRDTAYKDEGGKLSIGYGHTKDVKAGDTITKPEANVLLSKDLIKFENLVADKLKKSGVKFKKHEFDMLVSHVFNTGELNATEHFIEWGNSKKLHDWWNTHYITVNGKASNGLVNRRNAELAILKNKY
jgi:GH24 family phage-related lysozyme (muramidase)